MKRLTTWDEIIATERDLRCIGGNPRQYLAPSGAIYQATKYINIFEKTRRKATTRMMKTVYPDMRSGRRVSHHLRKLSDDDVRAIRAARPDRTLRDIAEEYGVSHNAIWLIVQGKVYKDIPS